jgi:hypothetical protein
MHHSTRMEARHCIHNHACIVALQDAPGLTNLTLTWLANLTSHPALKVLHPNLT